MGEVAEILTGNRVVPGPDWSKERKLLWKLIKEEGTKQEDVAREIGKSRSAVSLYISNKLPGSGEFEEKVREYLMKIGYWEDDEQLEPAAGGEQGGPYVTDISEIGFIETEDYRRVVGVCEMAARNKEFGIVVGAPGTGKTRSLEKYVAQNEAVLVTCDQTSTVKSILIDTAVALGIEARGSSPTIARRIVQELKRRPRLLIYDEADMLKKVSLLETVRSSIYDKVKVIGVVLVGNQSLAERILEMAEDRPELARIRDRVGMFTRLQGLTNEEACRFVDGVNLTPGARKMLAEVGRKRGIRQLAKALGRLLEVTRGERIDEDLVAELNQIVLSFNT